MDGDEVARALEQLRDEIRRNGEEVRALSRGIAGGPVPGPTAAADEQLVTLDQMAARLHVSKRSMERHKKQGMPPPAMKGKRGRAARWRWSEVRPWLEAEFGCTLDARFPVW